MSVFQCKMCGGQLDVHDGESIATCPYCSTKQTIPKLSDDKVRKILEKANTLRINGEYDKAIEQYERLIEEDTVTDAEIYWNMVLSKYGILYVDDPSGDKVPTVNRTQMTSVFLDDSYKKTIDLADPTTRQMYEDEAKKIDKIQQEILAISKNEKPYDIFICYKESDDKGETTQDSVDAYQIYHNLTNEGYRVFFARVSLEGKVGKYEPYIFSALNSAKVMLVIGSKKEYFEAPWVKNEWMRYLHLMKQDPTKRNMIPCYKGISPYDLPKELTYLQAQNMNNIGFIQDLLRGINKVFNKNVYNNKNYERVIDVDNKIRGLKNIIPNTVKKFKENKILSIIFSFIILIVFAVMFIMRPKTFNVQNAYKAKELIKYDPYTSVEKVDSVNFGQYPQNDASGKNFSPIEWIVLERNSKYVVMISKYILDNRPYNTNDNLVTWRDCTLRNWLNNEFYNIAFTESEKQYIVKNIDLNDDIVDNVTILNKYNINKYFGADLKNTTKITTRTTKATKYAKSQYNNEKQLKISFDTGVFKDCAGYTLKSTDSGSFVWMGINGSVSTGGYYRGKNGKGSDAYCEFEGIRPIIAVKTDLSEKVNEDLTISETHKNIKQVENEIKRKSLKDLNVGDSNIFQNADGTFQIGGTPEEGAILVN